MPCGPGDRPNILLVDDVPANLRILVDTFRGQYEVRVATSGREALEILRGGWMPDIVLLDIMMPEMDGYEVCRRLKADSATAGIPIVFVTAMTDADDEAKGLELGAVDYVTKPFRPNLVKARVRNHLELKRHRDHLEQLVRERTVELEQTRQITIESLAGLAETRDPETGGHINRTRNYVLILAAYISGRRPELLDMKTVELLHASAPLHDIGKVGVPDRILLKPGKLTDEEFGEMKKHTLYGRNALARVEARLGSNSFLRLAAEIAWTHHEKWDGSGYPQGLVGEAIPLSGRLMALADVYDALVSRRVYKPPLTHSQAVAIISEGRGKHFDPGIVDAFLATAEAFRSVASEYADSPEERQAVGQ